MFDSRTTRYTMFGLLYFAQGAILSYFTALNLPALFLIPPSFRRCDHPI